MMGSKNNKKKLKWSIIKKASYTVEAALIMPIIVIVIMALLYMGFYMHDKSRIQAIINSNLIRAGLIIKHEMLVKSNELDYVNLDSRGIYYPILGDIKQERERIINNLSDQFTSNLYLAQIKDINVEVDHFNINIKVVVFMDISILKVKELFTGSGTNITISSNGRVHYPAEAVRKFDAMEGMIDDVKGYDQVLGKLNSFIQ